MATANPQQPVSNIRPFGATMPQTQFFNGASLSSMNQRPAPQPAPNAPYNMTGFGDVSGFWPYGQSPALPQGPFGSRGVMENRYGEGAYGLPAGFVGWSGPARYSLLPAASLAQNAQGATDLYKKQMGQDWAKNLYTTSTEAIDSQLAAGRQGRQQALAKAGYGGGGTISPFAAAQVQQEDAARAGLYGTAARQAVLSAQQMESEAGRNYLNSLAQTFQALITPAQIETSRQAKVPTTAGVNYLPAAISGIGNVLGGLAGGALS